MNIFIPYNKKYLKQTYNFADSHISFIEDVVLRHLLKRLLKSNLVDKIDFYSQSAEIIRGIHSQKLEFVSSTSSEHGRSEDIIRDYLNHSHLEIPFVYYNLMFPFTDIHKINNALEKVNSGFFESAAGVIYKGIVWSAESADNIDIKEQTPSQSEINTWLDIGSFCVVKPEHILKGYRRITPPICFVPLTSKELINTRTHADRDIYELIIASGMS